MDSDFGIVFVGLMLLVGFTVIGGVMKIVKRIRQARTKNLIGEPDVLLKVNHRRNLHKDFGLIGAPAISGVTTELRFQNGRSLELVGDIPVSPRLLGRRIMVFTVGSRKKYHIEKVND